MRSKLMSFIDKIRTSTQKEPLSEGNHLVVYELSFRKAAPKSISMPITDGYFSTKEKALHVLSILHPKAKHYETSESGDVVTFVERSECFKSDVRYVTITKHAVL